MSFDEPPIRVVKETYLSRRPAPESAKVATASVVALAAVSCVYWLDPLGVARLLPASGESVLQRGEYWRVLTAMGAHADLRQGSPWKGRPSRRTTSPDCPSG